mmetsp:Transcript_14903/g.35368  ORF Transcript_14903/g.35368 Transcript_14903/m.35368 type:complete len:81 (+) Transcript_14903:581-823(+)
MPDSDSTLAAWVQLSEIAAGRIPKLREEVHGNELRESGSCFTPRPPRAGEKAGEKASVFPTNATRIADALKHLVAVIFAL